MPPVDPADTLCSLNDASGCMAAYDQVRGSVEAGLQELLRCAGQAVFLGVRTLQSSMWQVDITGAALFVMDCLDTLGTPVWRISVTYPLSSPRRLGLT